VGYPGANTAVSLLIVGPLVILVAAIYSIMSIAMPRSGGDYVWVSRILHPAIGFMQNFYMMFAFMYWTALIISWVPNWYLSTLLGAWGVWSNNPALSEWGSKLTTPEWTFIIGSLFIPYIFGLLMSGMKNVARVQKILFVIANFGMFALIAVLFVTPTNTFVSNLNEYLGSAGSAATYESIVETSKTVGYQPGWYWLPTIIALPYAFGMYGGYNWSSYVGGEVKDASRKISLTIIPTAILSIIFFVLIGFGIFQMTGYDFYNGIQYVFYLKPEAYPEALILPPLINYFITFATKNFAIVFTILFCFVINGIWMMGGIPTFASRCFFAWSFDRILPSKLADVSERFHVPLYILTLQAILSWVCLYLMCFTQFFAYQANVYVGWMICYAIVGLSITIFPWTKKQLYETTVPSRYKRKIAGIPVLSILGAVMFGFFVFMTYAAYTNAALGGPISWASVGIGIFGILILGIVIYYISYVYHKRKGIDISLAFKEIPPE